MDAWKYWRIQILVASAQYQNMSKIDALQIQWSENILTAETVKMLQILETSYRKAINEMLL